MSKYLGFPALSSLGLVVLACGNGAAGTPGVAGTAGSPSAHAGTGGSSGAAGTMVTSAGTTGTAGKSSTGGTAQGGSAGSSAGSSATAGMSASGGAGGNASGGMTTAGDGGSGAGGTGGSAGSSASGAAGTSGGAGASGAAGAEQTPSDPCAVKKVDAGNVHTCALGYSGAIWCWGNNSYRAVGPGAPSGAVRTPYKVTAVGTDNVDVFTGQDTACVKKQDGSLVCWGSFDAPGWDHVQNATPLDVFGTDWLGLALHTGACAVRADHTVACMGNGSATATAITGFGNDVQQVSTSLDTVCAVKAGGSVMCGRMGGAAPVAVSGVADAIEVSTGGQLPSDSAPWGRLFAVTSAGTLYYGLGDGKAATKLTGFGSASIKEAYIGETTASEHVYMAGTADGTILTWGTNRCAALGDGLGGGGDTSHDRRDVTKMPATVSGVAGYRQFATGHEHACVIKPDYTLWCWGRNSEGQIGSGESDTACDSGAGSTSAHQPEPIAIELCP